MILDGIIRQSRENRATLALVSVDFTKAFDTVAHEHILGALRRKGLAEHVLGLIRDSSVGCVSGVKGVDGLSRPIDMKVGVKQGDPMSPLLFNVALDPLIQSLERRGKGFALEDQSVTTLAFADDLVMLSSLWEGMSKNIAILETFGTMRVQPQKCFGFLLKKGEYSVVVNDCNPWGVCSESLRLTGPEVTEKYLGMEFRMGAWIRAVGRAALKPSQKVEILMKMVDGYIFTILQQTACCTAERAMAALAL